MNLILGGTHGLGAEIAKVCHQRGEKAFVVGRSYDAAKHGEGMTADLSNHEDVRKLCAFVRQNAGEIERFFWVTGCGYFGDFANQPEADKMAAVNFSNALPVVQAAWREMLETGKAGHLVVVGSTSGEKPRDDQAVYAATKFAQVGFTRSLGLESERLSSPVKVALFLPGGMQTPFWEGMKPADYETFLDPAKVASHICKRIVEQADSYYEETIPRGSL